MNNRFISNEIKIFIKIIINEKRLITGIQGFESESSMILNASKFKIKTSLINFSLSLLYA